MNEETGSFTDILEVAAGEVRKGLREHPSPDELIAYQSDEFPKSERNRLQRHLAYCSRCTEAVLDLENFPDVEHRQKDLDPEAVRDRDWQGLCERLEISAAAETGPRREMDPPRAAGRTISFYQLLAATLLLAAIGLSVWVANLRLRVAALVQPQANIFVHDLLPLEEGQTRDSEAGDVLVIPPGMDRVVLILNQQNLRSYRDYRLEILDRDGGVLWQGEELVRTPEGSFSIELARDLLTPGHYRLRLYGLAEAETPLLASYLVRVDVGFSGGP